MLDLYASDGWDLAAPMLHGVAHIEWNPLKWKKSDVSRVLTAPVDPLGLSHQWQKDVLGEGGEIPGQQGYGDVSSDLGVDAQIDPNTGEMRRGGAFDDATTWNKEQYDRAVR